MLDIPPFLHHWDGYMMIGTYIFLAVGALILLYHELRVSLIRDFKAKYDYVNLYEIRYFWYAVIAFITAAALYANTIATETITESGRMLWFYVRLFIIVSATIIAYFIFFSMIRIYYPGKLEKRLQKLRSRPRISAAGNKMRKLSEEEEDAHLEASQIAEEESEFHSVDYDVWIDDATGEKKIEKYFSYQHSEQCPECGYYTFKINREELEVAPTNSEPGLLSKHYVCSYCNHREHREVRLSKLTENVA